MTSKKWNLSPFVKMHVHLHVHPSTSRYTHEVDFAAEPSGNCWNYLLDAELGICLCLSTEQLPSICARHADDVQSNIRVDDLRWTCCGHLRSRRGLQIILHSSEASRVLSAECRVGDIFVVVVGSIWVLACAQDMTARYRFNHAMERTADRGTLHS